MLMDRERRLSLRNVTPPQYSNGRFRGYNGYGILDRSENRREISPCRSSPSNNILLILSPKSSPPPSVSSSPGSNSPDRGYIEHRVSKFDTLAGVAIKYGVEIGDVKKMNGLVTDFQMFALKSLQIPLPGRHPPSPCLSNGSLHHGEGCSCHELESPNYSSHDVFDSFQSLRLQGECLETGRNYNTEASHRFFSSNGDNQYLKPFPSTNTPLNHHRKSRSLVSTLFEEVNKSPDNNTSQQTLSHKFIRRRQKSEADFTSRTPELLLKEENGSSNGGFSSIAGKGLALRSKASSRTNLSAESETGPVPISLRDAPLVPDRFCNVRKSPSTPSLQEPDGNGSLSLWPSSKWSLRPDLLTPAAITSSIFDGLPKPLTGRRNKTALD